MFMSNINQISPDTLRSVLLGLGVRNLVRRNNNWMGCCPNPHHYEERPSWGISINPPYMHGCFSCGFKGSLRQLLTVRGWSESEIDTLIGSETSKALSLDLDLEDRATNPDNNSKFISGQLLWPYRMAAPEIVGYMRKRGFKRSRVCTRYKLYYDGKKDRMVFPWYAHKLVGATGRALDPNEENKIISYGEGFTKGNFLYLPNAKLRSDKPVVLVEGELDAIAVSETKLTNVGALGQGNFTKHHAAYLKSLPVNLVVLCFDNDAAGEKLYHSANKVLSKFCDVRRVEYPDEFVKDPADFFKQDRPEELREMLLASISGKATGLHFNIDG